MDKSYLKFYHKFRIALKGKSESVKDSTIRRRYLRFYQKCNSNFKQGVLTPILVSHYICIGTKNHIKETRTTTVRRTFCKITNYFNNMCKNIVDTFPHEYLCNKWFNWVLTSSKRKPKLSQKNRRNKIFK